MPNTRTRSYRLTGRPFFESVRDIDLENAFWWLGQHTFVVKLGGTVLLIDPFLTDMPERNVPPLFKTADAAGIVDVVVCTHDHLDHIDPAAIPGLAQHTDAAFVAPRAHRDRMHDLGVAQKRLHLLNDGESEVLSGVTVHAIKAAHEFFDETDDGLFPFLGYVMVGNGKTVYHAGDTLWWEGLQNRLSRWSFDVAFVPINGRDAVRYEKEILGNMTYQEAADLLGGLDVRLAVPAHFDMFDFNAEDPLLFLAFMEAKYPGRKAWIGDYALPVSF